MNLKQLAELEDTIIIGCDNCKAKKFTYGSYDPKGFIPTRANDIDDLKARCCSKPKYYGEYYSGYLEHNCLDN